jgi:disulfide bond formation protein DsbB
MTGSDGAPRRKAIFTILALLVLALVAGPIGASVFVLGFAFGDSPCVLCWAQRTGMVLIALTGLFVLRYGPRPRYLGLAILIGALGVYMGVRHSALHLARDVGQGFSAELLGAHTYTWSIFIFWVCILAMALLLVALRDGDATRDVRPFGGFERVVAWLFLVAVGGNILQALMSTGPPPFVGQSDPVRFSFDPRHWVWSLEEWHPAPVSLRGRWAIDKPDVGGLNVDTTGGPFGSLPTIPVARMVSPNLPLEGPVTGLAYDEPTRRFLFTTDHGLFLVDEALSRVLRYAIVDPGFSVDLATFGDGAFLDSRTVVAVAENKSYVILREDDEVRPDAVFRYFLRSSGGIDEVSRGRFATVRARTMYVLSAASDPATNSIYTVSVPNRRVRRVVISRFDRGDLTLSEEFLPSIDPAAGLALRDKRSLDDLYPTAATVREGVLYVLSANDHTLVAIDLATRRIESAWTLPGLQRPVGMAFKGEQLFVAGQSGSLAILDVPIRSRRIPDSVGTPTQ